MLLRFRPDFNVGLFFGYLCYCLHKLMLEYFLVDRFTQAYNFDRNDPNI